jgi:hypothetical protein
MMRKAGHPTGVSHDYDDTDWGAVDRFAHECTALLDFRSRSPAGALKRPRRYGSPKRRSVFAAQVGRGRPEQDDGRSARWRPRPWA